MQFHFSHNKSAKAGLYMSFKCYNLFNLIFLDKCQCQLFSMAHLKATRLKVNVLCTTSKIKPQFSKINVAKVNLKESIFETLFLVLTSQQKNFFYFTPESCASVLPPCTVSTPMLQRSNNPDANGLMKSIKIMTSLTLLKF